MHLEAVSSPVTDCLGQGASSHLAATPEPPFLQAKKIPFPQPFHIKLVLQTLPQLLYPALDMLHHLNVLLLVRGPELDAAFEL